MTIRTWKLTDRKMLDYLIFLRSKSVYDFFNFPVDHPDYDPCVIYARNLNGKIFAIEDTEAEDLDEHIKHFLTHARPRCRRTYSRSRRT